MDKFQEIKEEILKRAKENRACADEYKRAYKSETIQELCAVIKENFRWCCKNNVMTADFINLYQEIFAENEIYLNIDIKIGFLLADDSATVRASCSATVYASDSATVRASGSATVHASGSATVHAYGSATVYASGSATVDASGTTYIRSYEKIECKISENAVYRVINENKIYYASDGITFEKQS